MLHADKVFNMQTAMRSSLMSHYITKIISADISQISSVEKLTASEEKLQFLPLKRDKDLSF